MERDGDGTKYKYLQTIEKMENNTHLKIYKIYNIVWQSTLVYTVNN